MARRGLTLIELLVVVAIVSLLLGLSLPALVRVRNQAQGAVCIQNLKTLSLAWLLYKDDNDDSLVGGQVGKTPSDWVQGPAGAGTIVECKKEGIRRGALYRYVGDMVDVYRTLSPIGDSFMLAATFGNVHGIYKPGNVVLKPKILKEGQDAVAAEFGESARMWLVFHGGSGSELSDIHETLEYGVIKMNVDTDTQYWFTQPV